MAILSTPAKLKTALAATNISLAYQDMLPYKLTHDCPETQELAP